MYNSTNTTLEGFVTQDPVMKQTKSGKSVSNFGIACRHYPSGSDEARVSFYDVECWEGLAKVVSEKVKKGKRLMIFGYLKQDRWEGSDGKNRSKVVVVANTIRALSSLSDKKDEVRLNEEKLAAAV